MLTSGHFIWLEICLRSNMELCETFIVREMPIYVQDFYYKMQYLFIIKCNTWKIKTSI